MTWPDAFAALFTLIGLSVLFHGFPDIKIGGKHNYYHNCDDNEE